MRARTPALAASGAARSLPSRPPAQRPAGAGGPDPCGGSRNGSGGEGPPRSPSVPSVPALRCPRSPCRPRAARLRRSAWPGRAAVLLRAAVVLAAVRFPLSVGEGSRIRPCADLWLSAPPARDAELPRLPAPFRSEEPLPPAGKRTAAGLRCSPIPPRSGSRSVSVKREIKLKGNRGRGRRERGRTAAREAGGAACPRLCAALRGRDAAAFTAGRGS